MAAPVKVSHPETKNFWEIPVLFEDEHLLALNKPASLQTIDEGVQTGVPDLMALLHSCIAQGKPWAAERGLGFLKNSHRLDAGVSGVFLLSKTPAAHEALANAFGTEEPLRRYLAIVRNNPPEQTFEVNAKIGPSMDQPGMMRVDPRHGKKSVTRFEAVEYFEGWTLIACNPFPDRPGQVRAHLKYSRLHVTGDKIYHGPDLLLSTMKPGFRLKKDDVERPLMNRPALHLEVLTVKHPVTSEPLTITAPLPKDMEVALKYLRKYARSEGTPQGVPPNVM